MFYSAVVVPVGTEVLGSPLLQGTITQPVTNWLNLIGIGWCLALVWDCWQTTDPQRWRRRLRAGFTIISVLLLAVLFGLHLEMDRHLDVEATRIMNKVAFRLWHVTYLWTSTAHWVIGLLMALLTLSAWRAEDQNSVAPVGQASAGS